MCVQINSGDHWKKLSFFLFPLDYRGKDLQHISPKLRFYFVVMVYLRARSQYFLYDD